jgi:hypothetical protein
MVTTRRRTGFSHDFPLFCALAKGDHARVHSLCQSGQAAAVCGPGNFSVLHACALLGDAASVPMLVAAGAPLNAALTLHHGSPELANWLGMARQEVGDKWLGNRWSLTRNVTPLGLALDLRQPGEEVAKALLRAGADAWARIKSYAPSLAPGPDHAYRHSSYQPSYMTWVVQHLIGAFNSGQLEVTSEQLGMLARQAIAIGGLGMCEGLLCNAAARAQPRLGPEDASRLLGKAVHQGHAGMVGVLLRLGVSHNLTAGKSAVVKAAEQGSGAVMALLLAAGAAITSELVVTVINKVQPELLQTLLKHGPLPKPTSRYAGGMFYSCPVLCLLRIRPKVGGWAAGWPAA